MVIGPCDKSHIGTSQYSCFCQGKSHAAAGMIANKPDRINRFPCPASRDDYFFTCQGIRAANSQFNAVHNFFRFGQTANADDSTGEMPAGRFHDFISETFQPGHIILYDRVQVHVTVHGRHKEYGSLSRHDGCR